MGYIDTKSLKRVNFVLHVLCLYIVYYVYKVSLTCKRQFKDEMVAKDT